MFTTFLLVTAIAACLFLSSLLAVPTHRMPVHVDRTAITVAATAVLLVILGFALV